MTQRASVEVILSEAKDLLSFGLIAGVARLKCKSLRR